MSKELDRLIESIDPSRTLDEVSARVDDAINSFRVKQAVIENWDAFVQFLADFCRHIEVTVLRLGHGAPDDRMFYWSRCREFLKRRFGPSGEKIAFEMVRTGKDGGLYRVLKTVAEIMGEEYADREISARVFTYWGKLSVDQKLAAAEAYLERYKHFLPSELTEGNGIRLKANFPEVLREHPKLIRQIRQVGR